MLTFGSKFGIILLKLERLIQTIINDLDYVITNLPNDDSEKNILRTGITNILTNY